MLPQRIVVSPSGAETITINTRNVVHPLRKIEDVEEGLFADNSSTRRPPFMWFHPLFMIRREYLNI